MNAGPWTLQHWVSSANYSVGMPDPYQLCKLCQSSGKALKEVDAIVWPTQASSNGRCHQQLLLVVGNSSGSVRGGTHSHHDGSTTVTHHPECCMRPGVMRAECLPTVGLWCSALQTQLPGVSI